MILQVEEIHNLLKSLLNHNSHIQHPFHLCALFLALLATILIFPFRQNSPSSSSSHHQSFITNDNDDFSDDDDSEYTSSEFEDEEDEKEEEEEEEERTGECFRVKGSSCGFTRRRSIDDFLSFPEIASSRSVVKLWDHIGYGFEHSRFSGGSVVSVYEDQGLQPGRSPAVVVSAGDSAAGNLGLRIWDTRLRCGVPTVMAESGGVQKVYVSDDGRYGLTVVDMRNSHFDSWMPYSFML
ncbi:uncharacterized protein LOC130718260 [Lotus japonicus]|uniref:uncharacterized protein LOC130718260 n=1 Tax=Lotus japonicus TaxID=34305 RepID=UPI00258CF10E|nr:uncharacterized protein LOC130718260 [Lotus japonicus]